jgi:hypothetical protein
VLPLDAGYHSMPTLAMIQSSSTLTIAVKAMWRLT